MNSIHLRKWHRRIGIALSPWLIIQAVTGLTLSSTFLRDMQEQVYSKMMGRRMPSLASFWKFVLVDGHTGGGIFGSWYTVLLGIGVITIGLSGTFIYLYIIQRNAESTKRKDIPYTTADASHEVQLPVTLPKLRRIWEMNWHIYTVLAFGFSSVVITAYYTNYLHTGSPAGIRY